MRTLITQRLRTAKLESDDRGAAIVAAIGVMIICLSLGVLIVSQAVSSQRDSGRTRARTVEIHTAEAGVDRLHARFQKGIFPRTWSSADAGEFGSLGPDEVGAEANIRYWNEAGVEMANFDSNGNLIYTVDDLPARAQILVTSENERATMAGIEPKRSFESEVLLAPNRSPRVGAAIFSGSTFTPSNNTSVLGEGADVWVDTGNYLCSNSTDVRGSIYVPGGGASLANGCYSVGSVEARDSIDLQNNSSIEMFARSKTGNLIISNNATVGRDAVLGGTYAGTNRNSVRGDIFENEAFPLFHESRGLPKVEFKPADWIADGFQHRSAAWFGENVLGTIPGHSKNACDKWPYKRSVWQKGIIKGPSTPTVVDLGECPVAMGDGATIELYADLAVFADRFIADRQLNIRSGDGKEHKLWLLVPSSREAECRSQHPQLGFGGIQFSNLTRFNENAPVFLFSPCGVIFSNNTTFYGQVYGDPVSMSNHTTVTYKELGVPGVDMMPGYVDLEGGWNVDVVYKRETGDRVN